MNRSKRLGRIVAAAVPISAVVALPAGASPEAKRSVQVRQNPRTIDGADGYGCSTGLAAQDEASFSAVDQQALASALDYLRAVNLHMVGDRSGSAVSAVPRLGARLASELPDAVSSVESRRAALNSGGITISAVELEGTLTSAGVDPTTGLTRINVTFGITRTMSGGTQWWEKHTAQATFDPATKSLESIHVTTMKETEARVEADLKATGGAPRPEHGGTGAALQQPAKSPATRAAEASGTYDRQAAVNYALEWACYRNPDYFSYGGGDSGEDCTNFASQVLYAGGWPEEDLGSGGSTDLHNWFHSPIGDSHTWTVADDIKDHFRGSGAWTIEGFSDLVEGDVLSADWDGNGTYTHTMIVTGKSDSGDPLLSYHSIDTRNRPLHDILATDDSTARYAASHVSNDTTIGYPDA